MKLVSYCEIHAQTYNAGEIDIFYTEFVFWYFTMNENLSSQNISSEHYFFKWKSNQNMEPIFLV